MTDFDKGEMQAQYDKTRHTRGPSIFDNRDTTLHEIAGAVFDVLLETELPPKAQAFLGALYRSFYGREPYHHLKVMSAAPGVKIKFASRIERAHEALEIADKIDSAVAFGEKLEAEVAAAMAKYDLSRREVFRRLKEIRKERIAWAELLDGKRCPTFALYVPKGFDVDCDGKLVIDKDSS
jgi:hypothetical protein